MVYPLLTNTTSMNENTKKSLARELFQLSLGSFLFSPERWFPRKETKEN
jgi:hypothetical protein